MRKKHVKEEMREFNEEPRGKRIDLGECAVYDWEKGCYVVEPCSVKMFTPEQLKRRDKINGQQGTLSAAGRLV